jgi:hypothetical protein
MRLLVITNDLGGPDFRQRIRVYLDILRANDLDCEVAELPRGKWQRGKLLRRAADFDGVLVHKKRLSWEDALWLRWYARKVIYAFDDAVWCRHARPEIPSRTHFAAFRRTVRLADQILVGSSYLAEQARKFNSQVVVLPIGLPVDEYGASSCARDDGKVRLVWIGSACSLGYLAQMRPVLEEIGRRHPSVVLRLICDDFIDVPALPVEKLIWSPESRRVGLATSDIGWAPLPDNEFTRGKCAFKVLEYSASALSVVASPVGTNVDHVVEGVTGFLAGGPDEWLDRTIRLIEHPELRRQMGAQGRIHAAGHDVRLIGPRFVAVLHDCLGNRS